MKKSIKSFRHSWLLIFFLNVLNIENKIKLVIKKFFFHDCDYVVPIPDKGNETRKKTSPPSFIVIIILFTKKTKKGKAPPPFYLCILHYNQPIIPSYHLTFLQDIVSNQTNSIAPFLCWTHFIIQAKDVIVFLCIAKEWTWLTTFSLQKVVFPDPEA